MGNRYVNARGEQFTSEILSMELEATYNDPLDVVKRDPESFDFIIDVVRRRKKR
jgi:hypothetical protein